jgi:hypothetical protein
MSECAITSAQTAMSATRILGWWWTQEWCRQLVSVVAEALQWSRLVLESCRGGGHLSHEWMVSGAKEGGAEGDGGRADPERGGLGGHQDP